MGSSEHSPHLATSGIDWSSVGRATFEVRQLLRYEYPGPIADLHQLLMLVPADVMGSQKLISHEITVSPPARPRYSHDRFGNRLCHITLPLVENTLEFTIALQVERDSDAGFAVRGDDEPDIYAVPSPLTEPTADMKAVIEDLETGASGPIDLAERINRWVYRRIRYTQGATGVRTTAEDAFEQRAGVCQDYAHLMIGLSRLAGIPARYVSGHLLGEGAMHAWVQALLPDPDTGDRCWIPFDPTHDRRAGMPYITVAIGRDYGDVSPTRGSFRAPYGGQLAGGYKTAGVLRVA